MKISWFFKIVFLTAALLVATEGLASNSVWILDIKGAIGPATADYVISGIEAAEEAETYLIVLRIDTPGGLDLSMRTIIKNILASDIPVISYVYPKGARAASAGTYILYASHIAAMAPATNLGAATPVQIGAPSIPSPTQDKDNEQPVQKSAMEKKIINDAVAYIEGLAELRGRNRQWAVEAVTDGSSLSATDALDRKVIDLIADNVESLMTQINGYHIKMESGTITLDTSNLVYTYHEPGWRSEFLSVITNPNIAYILMLAGIYGLLLEFYNPGVVVPGVVGSISLLLALYAFQLLPVSYAGVGLIVLGIMLMIAETFAPSFGALGFGGVISFVIGSIILIDTDIPAFQIALPVILALALVSVAFLFLVTGLIIKGRKQKVVTGLESLINTSAQVESVNQQQILVRLNGELWQVSCDETLNIGDLVTIVAAESVFLRVEKQEG